ncbi:uncharacterized protein LOC123507092 isoform X1 [Portunus trituberculatus]|uniref:uncharacterized protein LOC123507092 isoform X1 n=1 Tax=Portunus trituberculatus TaxID=210409 RepID=UPI001E1CF29E|nr:uncharacterized protein LOC123507092 isoform X1 [Portunus trituberculatus]
MPGTPLHLLLVAVLVSKHGGTLGDTTHCNATVDHDLGQGDVTTVLTATKNSTEHTKVGYVKPKEGFEGVSVEVQGGKNSEEAWFPADEMCLPANGSWWKLKVQVLPNTEQDKLTFRLYCGKCKWSCVISDIRITSMEGILLKAHGPSSWTTTPKHCTVLKPDYSQNISNKTCEKPPTRPQASINKPQSSSEIHWVAVVVGLVVATVVVVVVIVVCLKVKYRCRSNESQPQHPLTESASHAVQDTRNSLYEPLSVFQEAAAPPQHENAPRVIHNGL